MREVGNQGGFIVSLSTTDFSLQQVFQIRKFGFVLLGGMFAVFTSKSSDSIGVVSDGRIEPLGLITMSVTDSRYKLLNPILD